jgi:subtilase family serine protease
MKYQRLLGSVALLALVATSACSSRGGGSFVPSSMPATADGAQDPMESLYTPAMGYYPMSRANAAQPACGRTASPNVARCMAWRRTDLVPNTIATDGIPAGVGFTPADIASAYHLDTTKGGGQTIATVDAFGYTQAASDLAAFRKAAKLPVCGLESGCLRIVNQQGQTAPLPPVNTDPSQDWRAEQAVDLDALSAACPRCKIVLVETNSAQLSDLAAGAVTAAQTLHANVISNSFGGAETTQFAGQYSQPGHVIVAAAGDNGGGLALPGEPGGPIVPCTLPTVVCVGGTQLVQTGPRASARGWRETVWNTLGNQTCGGDCGATGSGCSVIIAKPVWQHDVGCTHRSAADLSAVASVNTPFAVYSVLFKVAYGSPWQGWGGTSLATPLIAGMFALAGNAASRHGATEIWGKHTAFNDIVTGTNINSKFGGPCASSVVYICTARTGYDGPTGWGTPNGTTDL